MLSDFGTLTFEIIFALAAMGGLMFAVYGPKDAMSEKLSIMCAALMLIVALSLVFYTGERYAFSNSYIDDAFGRFVKIVILVSSALVLLMSQDFLKKADLLKFEFPILILLATVGMMIMVSANDLLVLYMGLELQSLALYILAAFNRKNLRSTEAGLKYFVLGALSSGILLYGLSLVYGYVGATNFIAIAEIFKTGEIEVGALLGLVFVFSALAFKISAAPFHMWAPDVYEGSPTPVTAFFATAPKMAAMALFARVAFDAFGAAIPDWSQIIAGLGVISMFVGSIAAIGQRDIKRLMAYSSIAHMGFALIGLATGTIEGMQALLIYMVIYVVMNIGTFAFILSMQSDGKAITDIVMLKQFAKTDPAKALGLLILMFSLAGVPPFVGFFGKFYVLNAAINADMAWLALLGVIASVIGAFYYLRIVYYVYFGETEEGLEVPMSVLNFVILMATAFILVFGVLNLFGLERAALIAAQTLVG